MINRSTILLCFCLLCGTPRLVAGEPRVEGGKEPSMSELTEVLVEVFDAELSDLGIIVGDACSDPSADVAATCTTLCRGSGLQQWKPPVDLEGKTVSMRYRCVFSENGQLKPDILRGMAEAIERVLQRLGIQPGDACKGTCEAAEQSCRPYKLEDIRGRGDTEVTFSTVGPDSEGMCTLTVKIAPGANRYIYDYSALCSCM